jgi:hypothetical protein
MDHILPQAKYLPCEDDAWRSECHEECQDWANTKAAYRFFNERISESNILAGHFACTRERFSASRGFLYFAKTPSKGNNIHLTVSPTSAP